MEKKAKAEAKRTRRLKRKEGRDDENPPETPDVELGTPDESD